VSFVINNKKIFNIFVKPVFFLKISGSGFCPSLVCKLKRLNNEKLYSQGGGKEFCSMGLFDWGSRIFR
jgi:hypothetical protein